MKSKGKWYRQKLDVKTRICRCCSKRKDIDEFYWQKPPHQHKIKQHVIGRRTECKTCHGKKCKRAYVKRTTKVERRIYIRNYMRQRNNTLPDNFRIAA